MQIFSLVNLVSAIPFAGVIVVQRKAFRSSGELLCIGCTHGFRIVVSNGMPTGSRILGFNRNEVVNLLRECCNQTGRSLPENFVENLNLVQGRPVTVKVRWDPEGSILEFAENELAAAIIMYCVKRGIPMARHALKSLEISHDTVFLHLRMGPESGSNPVKQ